MNSVLFVLISVALITLLVRPVTVFIRQFGHALPILIFSKQPVYLLIGKNPRYKQSEGIKIGRLTLNISKNPLNWTYGFCYAKGILHHIDLNILSILAGLLFSLAVSTLLFISSLNPDVHGLIKVFTLGLVISSLVDMGLAFFLSNVKGKITNESLDLMDRSDADQLKLFIHAKKIAWRYKKAVKFHNAGNTTESMKIFEALTDNSLIFSPILANAALVYEINKEFDKAISALKRIIEQFPDSQECRDAFQRLAFIYILHLKDEEKAKEVFAAASEKFPENSGNWGNYGFCLLSLNDFHNGLDKFNIAIDLDPNNAYYYANRGLCKLKIGDPEGGHADFEYAKNLNPNEPYIYRCLGLAKMDSGEFASAISFFEKAKELEPSTYRINDLIIQSKDKLEKRV